MNPTSPHQHVTVVLPTYRRDDALARAMQGLAVQEDPGVTWDLVVVDNEDPPGADATYTAGAEGFPVPVRLVREAEKGACSARNRGLAEVTGTIVAFIDDDVVPNPDWLRRIIAPILAGRCDGTGGRVVLDPTVPVPGWMHPHVLALLSAFDLGDEERPLEPPDDYLLTANAAFVTEGIRAIGGFDPSLGPRPGVPMVNDDVDLFRRLVAAGHAVHYVPDAVVTHELPPERLNPKYVIRRAYAGGRSDWVLDRARFEDMAAKGTGGAVGRLGRDAGSLVLHGFWRRDLTIFATWVARVAGFCREAVRGRSPRTRSAGPTARDRDRSRGTTSPGR